MANTTTRWTWGTNNDLRIISPTLTTQNVVINSDTFSLTFPKVSIYYTGNIINNDVGRTYSFTLKRAGGGTINYGSSASVLGGEYGVLSSRAISINTNTIFNANNKNERNATISYGFGKDTGNVKANITYTIAPSSGTTKTFVSATATLDAPPEISYNITSQGPYYSKAGNFTGSEYTVLVSYEAQYGGDITSIKLQFGNQVKELNPNITNGQSELSIYTIQSGNFTPIITVTDSRNQVTSLTLPLVTVNQYTAPTLSYELQRANNNGQIRDEGECALITTNISYINNLSTEENNYITQPTITVLDGQTTLTTVKTWYAGLNSSGVNSPIVDWETVNPSDTIYALVTTTNGFITDKSYTFSISVTDTHGLSSQTISQILSTAFYMLDFRAGGRGMAIGKIADKDGLEVQFPTMIGEGLSTPLTPLDNGKIDITKYQLVVGKYNEIVEDALFVIGAGTSTNKANVFVIDENGNLTLRSRQDSNSDRYTGLDINHNPYIDDEGLPTEQSYDASAGSLTSILNYTSNNTTYQHKAGISVSSNEYPTFGNTVQLDALTYNTTQSTPTVLKSANLTLRTTATTSEVTINAGNIKLTSAGALTVGGKVQDGSGNVLANKADSSSNINKRYIIVGDWKIVFGSETMNSNNASGSGTFTAPYYADKTVTFASGTFSATPYVYLQLQGGWTGSRWVTPDDVTTTNFKIRMYSSHKNSTTTTIRWWAVGRP